MRARIGFHGPLRGMTAQQKTMLHKILSVAGEGELHHGDLKGGDAEAHEIAIEERFEPVIHPGFDLHLRAGKRAGRVHPAMAPILRCKTLVNESDFVVVALGAVGEGINYTRDFALQAGKNVLTIARDGRMFLREARSR